MPIPSISIPICDIFQHQIVRKDYIAIVVIRIPTAPTGFRYFNFHDGIAHQVYAAVDPGQNDIFRFSGVALENWTSIHKRRWRCHRVIDGTLILLPDRNHIFHHFSCTRSSRHGICPGGNPNIRNIGRPGNRTRDGYCPYRARIIIARSIGILICDIFQHQIVRQHHRCRGACRSHTALCVRARRNNEQRHCQTAYQ